MLHLSQLNSINYTPDIVILIILGTLIAYGILLGRNKVKTLAMSVYVGIVVAGQLGARLAEVLNQQHASGGHLSTNSVQLTLFVLPLIILELGRREHHGRGGHRGGLTMTLVLVLLTAALIVSSGLNLLDANTLHHVLVNSALANAVYHLRLWWIGLVPVAVIGENFIRPRE